MHKTKLVVHDDNIHATRVNIWTAHADMDDDIQLLCLGPSVYLCVDGSTLECLAFCRQQLEACPKFHILSLIENDKHRYNKIIFLL